MCSSLLQLAVESRDLSQAEKNILVLEAEQIHQITTFFTQNEGFLTWTIVKLRRVVILRICSACI